VTMMDTTQMTNVALPMAGFKATPAGTNGGYPVAKASF